MHPGSERRNRAHFPCSPRVRLLQPADPFPFDNGPLLHYTATWGHVRLLWLSAPHRGPDRPCLS